MEEKIQTMQLRLILAVISLITGFIAANLALFHWHQQENIYYLMGDYARYACAYGGFAAMILGAVIINDFLDFRNQLREKNEMKHSIFNEQWE